MILKNTKLTESDRRYFDLKAKITEAAREGKLGREWYAYNPTNGKYELRPKRIYKHI